ncbi:MAG TPA: bifunctional serine/threonine-protein kinase/formylglycine-generating enzyme family protein [Candidatus Didemnitutus sp.]|nr:bifunctional serine/threonine-protein kinase/formylglycine-generating enzyme family protein [Candidatus Didemnitutus sp.]
MEPNPEKTVFVPRTGPQSDLFQNGEIVGQYKVERVLGAGGMGVVYLVKHTALGKKFALKALPANLGQDPDFVRRFKREATTLGVLKHNHVVNVTDFGENQGRLYLVLEYVDGGSLEEWFEKNRVKGGGAPPDQVRKFLTQILEGLAHAHQAGIIHRDLKPANVLLEKTGEAKISDFGLARAVAEEEYRRAGGTASPFQGDSVTTTGAIVGTIDFMSPEARNMQTSDARSDIYAIGVIAYLLLTGKKPTGIAKPASEVVKGLDPRWDKFITRCLADDPKDRYQNGAAALEGFQQLLSGSRSKSWVLPAIIGAIVVAGIVTFAVRSKPPEPPPETPKGILAITHQAPAGEAPKVETLPVKATPPPPRTFFVTGLPAGAVVAFQGHSYPADATGRARLEFPPGPQTIQVKAPGYVDWEGEMGAQESDLQGAVTMELVPPHAVRFTGLPAQAQIKAGDQAASADASGAAVLQLRPGHVVVNATAPKYDALELPVDVLATTDAVAVEMKKTPPPVEVVVKLSDAASIKFHWIPAGSAYLGSLPDERGHQRSDLERAKFDLPKGMYFAETEMTQRQHRALTGRNPSDSRALGDDSRPVEQVSWYDVTGSGGVLDRANELIHRLGLPYKVDLPTEMEWEYACRAGTASSFNDGSNVSNERDDPALDALAYYARGGMNHDAPSPVAKFKANAWGLFDMLGNVSEWAYSARGQHDPVLRGGNWSVGVVHCRSASRVEVASDARPTYVMGYRLVLRPLED